VFGLTLEFRICAVSKTFVYAIADVAFLDLREGSCDKTQQETHFRAGEGLKFPTIARTGNSWPKTQLFKALGLAV
jgi:hypothetical protein